MKNIKKESKIDDTLRLDSVVKNEIQSDIIRGHLDTILLKALNERDMYGYEISKVISDKVDGVYELNSQSLYSAIRRLEKSGHLSSYWGDESQGGRRKYYKITDTGRVLLQLQIKNWEFAKSIINKLLDL